MRFDVDLAAKAKMLHYNTLPVFTDYLSVIMRSYDFE